MITCIPALWALFFPANYYYQDSFIVNTQYGFLSQISVLSIHVSDTITHDSVFHFLNDKLGLAVEYYPEKWGERKYAGLYAGNMYLEPCGPFRGFKYPKDKFKAVYYGLNCESQIKPDSIERFLLRQNINYKRTGSIQITDSMITGNNLFFNIVTRKDSGRLKEFSQPQQANSHSLHPQIMGIKEIWIGIDNQNSFEKWNDLLYPFRVSFNDTWKINKDQTIRFVKSEVIEIKAIVFRVRSLPEVKQYLSRCNLLDYSEDGLTRINSSRTFGLIMYFSE